MRSSCIDEGDRDEGLGTRDWGRGTGYWLLITDYKVEQWIIKK